MKVNKNYLLKEVAGEFMLVYQDENNVDFSKVITLNELGAFIFKSISNGLNKEQIVDAILSEYEGASKEEVTKDVNSFIEKLNELGIVYA